jgi:hypothetical protein
MLRAYAWALFKMAMRSGGNASRLRLGLVQDALGVAVLRAYAWALFKMLDVCCDRSGNASRLRLGLVQDARFSGVLDAFRRPGLGSGSSGGIGFGTLRLQYRAMVVCFLRAYAWALFKMHSVLFTGLCASAWALFKMHSWRRRQLALAVGFSAAWFAPLRDRSFCTLSPATTQPRSSRSTSRQAKGQHTSRSCSDSCPLCTPPSYHWHFTICS